MKTNMLYFSSLLALCFNLCGCASSRDVHPFDFSAASSDDPQDAHIKLLHITANVDGSGKFIFTGRNVRYEHLHWSPPTHVMIDGQSWENLRQPFAGWKKISKGLDLSRAWIVRREGRDVIALESTPRGFDLYLDDSPNGSADYSVTIAIPRNN